jgi:hypothetical protein
MIVRAIKTAQMDFMKNLYFYNKNYERPKGFQAADLGNLSDSEDELNRLDATTRKVIVDRFKTEYVTFTLNYLVKKIIELWPDDYPSMLTTVAGWKLE